MTYVELDLEDKLYEKLQELADEEGMSTEDLIVDILEDEASYEIAEDETEDYEEDDYGYGSDDYDDN